MTNNNRLRKGWHLILKLWTVSAIQRFTTAVLPLVVIAAFLLLFSSACSQPETTPTPGAQEINEAPTYWPAEDWRTSTPEEQGMD